MKMMASAGFAFFLLPTIALATSSHAAQAGATAGASSSSGGSAGVAGPSGVSPGGMGAGGGTPAGTPGVSPTAPGDAANPNAASPPGTAAANGQGEALAAGSVLRGACRPSSIPTGFPYCYAIVGRNRVMVDRSTQRVIRVMH